MCCAWFLEIIPLSTNAGSLAITAAADTMIRDTADTPPGDGSSDGVEAGTTRLGQTARILLQFAMTGFPTNATLTNATLRLNVIKAPSAPPDAPFSLHRMLLPWNETNADWFGSGVLEWSQPGGMAGLDFVAEPSATNQIPGTGIYVFSAPALFDEVRSWMTNSASNHGWMLLCDTEGVLQTARRFGTRESSDPGQRPQLILDYTAPLTIELKNPRKENGQFVFEFTATPGTDYIIQYKDDISSDWAMFDYYPDPGVETVFTIVDDGDAQRFFRVLSATTP